MCYNSCNECPRKVFSDGVTVVTIDGTATLVVDVPFQRFNNCQKGCIVIVQSIPDTATVNMPVAISIGGDTDTVYPVVNCAGVQATAPMLRTRRRYPYTIATNATGGVFKLKNLSCAPNASLDSIPVEATDAPAGG